MILMLRVIHDTESGRLLGLCYKFGARIVGLRQIKQHTTSKDVLQAVVRALKNTVS